MYSKFTATLSNSLDDLLHDFSVSMTFTTTITNWKKILTQLLADHVYNMSDCKCWTEGNYKYKIEINDREKKAAVFKHILSYLIIITYLK